MLRLFNLPGAFCQTALISFAFDFQFLWWRRSVLCSCWTQVDSFNFKGNVEIFCFQNKCKTCQKNDRPSAARPFKYKRQPEIPPTIRDIHLWACVCGHRSAGCCQQFHRIPTAPCGSEGHIAFWENLTVKIPSGHSPNPHHPHAHTKKKNIARPSPNIPSASRAPQNPK